MAGQTLKNLGEQLLQVSLANLTRLKFLLDSHTLG